jgi:hypothetical protein
MNKINVTAFCTTTTFALATIGAAVGCATVAATVSAVALGVLAVTLGAISISAITAWVHTKGLESSEQSVGKYFENLAEHAGYAVAGFFQVAAQTMVQAVLQGLARGVSRKIADKVSA